MHLFHQCAMGRPHASGRGAGFEPQDVVGSSVQRIASRLSSRFASSAPASASMPNDRRNSPASPTRLASSHLSRAPWIGVVATKRIERPALFADRSARSRPAKGPSRTVPSTSPRVVVEPSSKIVALDLERIWGSGMPAPKSMRSEPSRLRTPAPASAEKHADTSLAAHAEERPAPRSDGSAHEPSAGRARACGCARA